MSRKEWPGKPGAKGAAPARTGGGRPGGLGGFMHANPYIVLGSAVVGFLVGLTGAAGER